MAEPTYLLMTTDTDLTESRVLTADPATSNIQLVDGGPTDALTIDTVFNLGSLAAINSAGLAAYTGSNTFASRAITSSGSINVTNGTGAGGNIVLDTVNSTSTQKVNLEVSNVSSGAAQSTINFIPSTGIGIAASVNGSQYDVTISAQGDGTGTVTSVSAECNFDGITFSGVPITTAGSIHFNLPTSGATLNKVLGITDISPLTVGWLATASGDIVENDSGLSVGSTAVLPTTAPNPGQGDVLVGIGVGSAGATPTGGISENVAVGINCFSHITTGNLNTAVGWSVLDAVTTGNGNTGVGQNSLLKTTTGGSNTGFGTGTCRENIGGGNNTAVGASALLNNQNGVDNTVVGRDAGLAIQGSSNTGIGRSALTAWGGGRCTAVGWGSFGTMQGGTNANNSGIGYNSGATQLGYTNCTFLGASTDASANALTNATAVGYSSTVGISNALILGGTTTSGVKVGIGTTSPDYGLHLGVEDTNFKPHLCFSPGTVPTTPATAGAAVLYSRNNGIAELEGGVSIESGTAIRSGMVINARAQPLPITPIVSGPWTCGTVELSDITGVATVLTTAVKSTSVIMLSYDLNEIDLLTPPDKPLSISAITPGVSFVVRGNPSTTGVIAFRANYLIINPD